MNFSTLFVPQSVLPILNFIQNSIFQKQKTLLSVGFSVSIAFAFGRYHFFNQHN